MWGFVRPYTINSQLPLDILRSYSSRNLTHDSDILRAITGILCFLERQGFKHHWGMPILTRSRASKLLAAVASQHDSSAEEARVRPRNFIEQLSPLSQPVEGSNFNLPMIWVISMIFLVGLGWELENHVATSALRRPGFPSWSWSGWKARIRRFPWEDWDAAELWNALQPENKLYSPNITVQFEKLDGTLLDLASYIRSDCQSWQAKLSRFVHITAFVTPISFVVDVGAFTGYDTSFRQKDGRWECLFQTTHLESTPKAGYVLYLGEESPMAGSYRYHKTYFGPLETYTILIGEVNGHYERLETTVRPLRKSYFGYGHLMEKTLRTIRLG